MSFGNYFNKDISKVIFSSSLRILSFGREFNQDISEVVWPKELTSLEFGAMFDKKITNLSQNILYLTLDCDYKYYDEIDKTYIYRIYKHDVGTGKLDIIYQKTTGTLTKRAY